MAKIETLLDNLEKEASRNKLTEYLSDYFNQVNADIIAESMYFLQGRVAPKFVDKEFGMSTELVIRALEDLVENIDVKKLYKLVGDIGLVVSELPIEFADNLSFKQIFDKLDQITRYSGTGSQQEKIDELSETIKLSNPQIAKYIVRVVVGKLRLGVSDKTILDSLSVYITGDKKLKKKIETAYGARADIGLLAKDLVTINREKSIDEIELYLNNIKIEVGTPVASKLVERESSPESTFDRIPHSLVQPKLDGMRAQIHYKRGEIFQVYSRNMESLTHMFPDLKDDIDKTSINSIILDSEVIGYDQENQVYLDFQQTITRRRKHNVDDLVDQVPIRAMCFDILYLDGQDISQQDLEVRVSHLSSVLSSCEKLYKLETVEINELSVLSDYFWEAVTEGLEGVIVKSLGTTYQPGTRNFDWIKLKANSQSELVDTIDVVVLGFYYGKGERNKYGFGSLLTGIYNSETGNFESLAKIGSGFTDENAPIVKQDLEEITTQDKPENVLVDSTLYPDVWVEPKIVMEIDADEITRSPSHMAAKAVNVEHEPKTEKGLSVRFPRLKHWNRDKDAEQATSTEELLTMYSLRKKFS